MPAEPPTPGAYIEELPEAHHWVRAVDTSTTAFLDFFPRGPLDHPLVVDSVPEFLAAYGDLDPRSQAAYDIRQFFQHGGRRAVVQRVSAAGQGRARPASVTLADGRQSVSVEALSAGQWGNELQVAVEVATSPDRFALVVRQVAEVGGVARVLESETHDDLSMDLADPRYAVTTVTNASQLVRLVDDGPDAGQPERPLPALTATAASDPATLRDPATPGFLPLTGGSDGDPPRALDLAQAMPLLDHAEETIGLVCIPAMAGLDVGYDTVAGAALAYCRQRRAFLLLDLPLEISSSRDAVAWVDQHRALRDPNAAFYYPPLVLEEAHGATAPARVAPSGAVAGLCARTDADRGVWKAPAGLHVAVRGARAAVALGDDDSAVLNPRGVNAIRTFPGRGAVVWGARTSVGLDDRVSEWRYVSVRRLALMVEQSLWQGLQWAVFEPNDESLWARLRSDVEVFLHDLFRQGAFVGASPREAFFVTCDSTTTTAGDIADGVVNVVVGFAPSRPSEFVVVPLRLRAGHSPH